MDALPVRLEISTQKNTLKFDYKKSMDNNQDFKFTL